MNTIQLDECMNSKRLIRTCATEGKIATLAFPDLLSGRSIKDPEMLQWWNALGVMLLTKDSSMRDDHTRFIPNSHKGIVVICNRSRPSFGLEQMLALLSLFKRHVPEWPAISLDNAIIELWHSNPAFDVRVFRVSEGEVEWEESFSYSSPQWKQSLFRALDRAKAAT